MSATWDILGTKVDLAAGGRMRNIVGADFYLRLGSFLARWITRFPYCIKYQFYSGHQNPACSIRNSQHPPCSFSGIDFRAGHVANGEYRIWRDGLNLAGNESQHKPLGPLEAPYMALEKSLGVLGLAYLLDYGQVSAIVDSLILDCVLWQ